MENIVDLLSTILGPSPAHWLFSRVISALGRDVRVSLIIITCDSVSKYELFDQILVVKKEAWKYLNPRGIVLFFLAGKRMMCPNSWKMRGRPACIIR